MKNFRVGEEGVSPLFGVVLLVGLMLTMLLAFAVLTSVFAVRLPESAPQASIVVEGAKGGLLNDTPQVDFNENWITLYNRMGYPLNISRTKIQIKGYGETQDNSGIRGNVKGNIIVEYTNLKYDGKLEAKPQQNKGDYSDEYHGYAYHNPDLSDGYWNAGEKLILNGEDSKNPGASSTVKVYMEGISNTDNNWRFNKSGQITITVIDIQTNQVIASLQTTVKPA